jgi:hypothetical protein
MQRHVLSNDLYHGKSHTAVNDEGMSCSSVYRNTVNGMSIRGCVQNTFRRFTRD